MRLKILITVAMIAGPALAYEPSVEKREFTLIAETVMRRGNIGRMMYRRLLGCDHRPGQAYR